MTYVLQFKNHLNWVKGIVIVIFAWGIPFTAGSSAILKELYFTIEPSDIVTVRDAQVLLNCSAKGPSSPTYEWRRDGTTVQFIGDTRRSLLSNGSLFISEVHHTRNERPDEGIYQCVASLPEVGTIVSKPAKLHIANLPRFDEQPHDITVYPGQTAYFPCSIQGHPPAVISWYKDDRMLRMEKDRFTLLPSGALEIHNVQSTDSGTYKCNASNVERHRISSSGTLTVSLDYAEANKLSAPHFIAVPRSTFVVESQSITLDCAANGNPTPKITWLKDAATIDVQEGSESRHRIIGAGSLLIDPAREGDEGTYMCRAENHIDSVDSSASLEIQVPPRFTKKPKTVYAYEKEDVELECEVYGKPEPQVHWLKNGDVIVQSEYFKLVNGYNLKVLGLVRSDAGVYQCFATNPAGSIQAVAQLLLLQPGDKPHSKDVPTTPVDVRAVIVSTRFVTLSWSPPERTNGEIIAYSVYYRETTSTRERVLNTTRLRLEEINIQGLQPSTKYQFRVVAYNQQGPGISSEEVVVETQGEVHVPGSPRNLKGEALSPTSIHVHWENPETVPEPVQKYKLFYMEEGTSEEREVSIVETSHTLRGLRKFTDYNFWVVAFNNNGAGPNSDEISVKTLSDFPSDTPQNVTIEASSSSTIIVRWEPPPKETQNGVIMGYKIRYKLKGSRRGDTVTTDGNRRLYALTGLEKGAQYSIKISALTINGSGPATDWIIVDTYQNDLDETRVPDRPSSLRAKPTADTIYVVWTPPRNLNTMIRGYTIGWGIGFPDVYTKVLDGKQRYYNIENLQPSSEYVISLRAFNQVGDGIPIYETVKTLIQAPPEPLTPMLPPVGLKAMVLSSSSVVLYWTDSTLSRNQLVTDNRYYTVRYSPYSTSSSSKFRYFNSTDLNCMIDDLRPNTQYEFSVKVVKGSRESTWSMSVINNTLEASPSSPPRDLTVIPSEDDVSSVTLTWQPPKQPNGQITGYVVFYTTDNTQDRDWIVDGIIGDKLSSTLRSLLPDTVYYFKIQAKNSKGYGPFSSEVVYKTPPGMANNFLYIIIAAVSGGIVVIILIIIVSVTCRRRHNNYLAPVQKNRYGGQKATGRELKPPDLWIHHDQMELKEKVRQGDHSGLSRSPHETDIMIDVMEKKKGSYIADDMASLDGVSESSQSRVKSFLLPPESFSLPPPPPTLSATTPVPNGGLESPYEMGSSGLARPIYPRTQYNIPHAHVTIDAAHPGSSTSTLTSPSSRTHHPYDQVTSPTLHITLGGASVLGGSSQHATYSSNTGVPVVPPTDCTSVSGTLSKRPPNHSLKSFSVPAPPCQSAPTTPQPRHIVKPQQVASPQKKLLTSGGPSPAAPSSQQSTLKSRPSTMPRQQDGNSDREDLPPSYSTEDLSVEMANLEGLMKDLNAITASEFEC
ncbi:neogenin isoform X5 [Parasteatoda tepidariorum]|uniref:neogenin isoform X5 n=1 Tax=Parasteatoda tepidariorum TaxID=114398 RepID=UPI00077FC6AF|nr:neogenin isoform X4 [Parasteatoda tepidariorum]